MELRELRTLLELASNASLARTAQTLNLTPAAVFKQLKNLEAEWGVQLYQRRGRGLVLTPVAEVVLPSIREVWAQANATRAAIEEWKGLRRAMVRIGTGPTLASYVLPDLLLRFRNRWTDVDVRIQTGNSQSLIDKLRAGELDAAILIAASREEDKDMQVAMEWKFESVLVSNLPDSPEQCRLRDLQRFPFVLYEKGSRLEVHIEQYFHTYNFHPNVPMRFDSAEALKAMVALGLGISILPLWTVRSDLANRRLRAITQRERPLISRFILVCRKAGRPIPPLAAFLEVARAFEPDSVLWLRHASPHRGNR